MSETTPYTHTTHNTHRPSDKMNQSSFPTFCSFFFFAHFRPQHKLSKVAVVVVVVVVVAVSIHISRTRKLTHRRYVLVVETFLKVLCGVVVVLLVSSLHWVAEERPVNYVRGVPAVSRVVVVSSRNHQPRWCRRSAKLEHRPVSMGCM